MKKLSAYAAIFGCFLVLLSIPACKKSVDETTPDDFEQEQLDAEKEAEDAAKTAETKPVPAPRMNEDIYVEITSRSALIRDKYKDEPEQAEKEIEALYGRFGVTFREYKGFQDRLDALKAAELQRKISEFMTRVAQEYRSP